MNDSDSMLSTRQAAELLSVHESTVKRWCNEGLLTCSFTRGGHRRISISDLLGFAERQSIVVSLHLFGDDAERVWSAVETLRKSEKSEALANLVFDWAAKGGSHLVAHLVLELLGRGTPLAAVMDDVVGPVMRRIGQAYQNGDMTIGDEHRMTAAVRDALILISAGDDLTRNRAVGPLAIVGCIRGEVHELGALMARALLLDAGWRVMYVGLDVPTEEYALQQMKCEADLICISMMPPMGRPEAHSVVQVLESMYDPARPYRLALGGSNLGAANGQSGGTPAIKEIQYFNRMRPFADWIDGLPTEV